MQNSASLVATEALSAASATHPRVTLEDLNGAIAAEHFFTAGEATRALGHPTRSGGPLDLLTICILVLTNGFTVIGKSAPASPENFDSEKGRTFARDDAIRQLWPLMGFALRDRLHQEQQLLATRAFVGDGPAYIGTKVVHARPLNRADYNALRGWTLPPDEDGADEGYLVEYTDRVEDPPHVPGFLGYVSWSPKDVFERAYRLA